MMELVLKYTQRRRPIVSLPFSVGLLQGLVLEQLPINLFTVTRAQVRKFSPLNAIALLIFLILLQIEQLKSDNVVGLSPGPDQYLFRDLVEKNSSGALSSVHDVLPQYLS